MALLKKLGIGILAFFLLTTCVGMVSGEDQSKDESSGDPGAAASKDDEKSQGDGDGAAEGEDLTQQDQWLANYSDRERRIRKSLARRVPAYRVPRDAAAEAVSSCDELVQRTPLEKRTSNASAGWGANAMQAAAVLAIVSENVCPEVAPVHTKQVAVKKKADEQAAARARVAAAKKAAQARRASEEAERIRELAQQPAAVYYDNCTAVKNAGAAPIYAGDPGYGSHLDRDGDGVACET